MVSSNKGSKLNVLLIAPGAPHVQETPRAFSWPKLYPAKQTFTVLEIQVSERSHEARTSDFGLVCA